MQPMPPRGVSVAVKALAGVVVVIALAAVWYLRRGEPASTAHAAASAAPAPAAPATSKPPQHATRITPEQRRELADKIAAARAVRTQTETTTGTPDHGHAPRPSLPDQPHLDPGDVDAFKTSIRSAMKEVIPMLADCYDKAGSAVPDELTVRAQLELTGDPDIGTLVDAPSATGDHEAALPAGFDDCLRSTRQTIELPPLTEGDEVSVTYPFVFRRE